MSNVQRRFSVGLVVVTIAALLLWWPRRAAQPMTKESPVATTAATTATLAPNVSSAPSSPGAVIEPGPAPTQKPSPELKRTFEILNHNPVEFYGRVIDQYDQPVPGAAVLGTLLVNDGSRSGSKRAEATTDAQGNFAFKNLKGQDLGMIIVKPGYEYRRRSSSFSYSYFEADHKRHIPDPKNPVIFMLWKKEADGSLVYYEKNHRFPADGTPLRLNLENGKAVETTGDLIFTMTRTPLRQPFGEMGFAWNATVDVAQGGLIRAGERDYYNLAPESGYEPRFVHVQEAQSVRERGLGTIKWTWTDLIEDTFFISCRNGQRFARVELRLMPNVDRNEGDNVCSVNLKVWLNPTGSRNLEYDPAKVIKPTP